MPNLQKPPFFGGGTSTSHLKPPKIAPKLWQIAILGLRTPPAPAQKVSSVKNPCETTDNGTYSAICSETLFYCENAFSHKLWYTTLLALCGFLACQEPFTRDSLIGCDNASQSWVSRFSIGRARGVTSIHLGPEGRQASPRAPVRGHLCVQRRLRRGDDSGALPAAAEVNSLTRDREPPEVTKVLRGLDSKRKGKGRTEKSAYRISVPTERPPGKFCTSHVVLGFLQI